MIYSWWPASPLFPLFTAFRPYVDEPSSTLLLAEDGRGHLASGGQTNESRPSGRAEPGPGLVKPSRARHKAWAGSGLGLEKCQARQASQARAWIYMAKSVPMAASVPSNAELYNANLSFGSSPLL
ncbi:hypothetical protein B0H16DRAFT_1455485 [Mycena metata]|uniref:Uncharacterized protein n=1 Tax=Mycena metata TaxID=1033252 RepID=A0AAD7JGQ4_9AGAR|nr:hypothetical protein B0H16DRAFT_1455485 [Mycena metata]